MKTGFLGIAMIWLAGVAAAVANEAAAGFDEWGSQPEYAHAAYDEAMSYLSKGRQKDAEWLVAEACVEAPDCRRLWFLKAVMQRSRFDWKPARESFIKAYRLGDTSVPSRASAVVVPMDMNVMIEAGFQTLEELIQEHPDEILVRWLYGIEARYHFKHMLKAEAQFKAVLGGWDLAPVMVHQTYAKLLTADLGKPEQALEHRMLAVELEPEPWSYQGLANTFKQLKRYEEADRVYGKLLEMQPYNAINWIQWGNCLFYMDDFAGAAGKYEKADVLNPRDVSSLVFWGRSLEKQGRPKEGFSKYAAAVERQPRHPQACSYAAISKLYGYGCKPDFEWATELAESGRGDPMEDLREYVRLADQSQNPLSPEKSAVLLKHLTGLAVDGNAEAQFNLGMIHYHGIGIRGDQYGAYRWFERAARAGHADGRRMYMKSSYHNRADPKKGLANEAYQAYRDRDYKKAAQLYEKAYNRDQGWLPANWLGRLYGRGGHGLEKNLDTAISWHLKALEEGHTMSYGEMIGLYISPNNPTHRDLDKALEYADLLLEGMPENYIAHRYAAKAYAQAGDFSTAIAVQQKAIDVGKRRGVESEKSIARAEATLEKYQRHEKPYSYD
jgi:tetratricopeptide (TPR) repeat protein